MRVLHIVPGNLYGGVETLLVTLARFKDLCPSMEPEFAVCFEGRLSGELAAAGVPVHYLGAVRVRNPLSILRARANLSGLLRRQRFDAVVCHMAWPQAVFGSVVRTAGVPLVFWQHLATDGRHWLERWARRTVPAIAISPSQFVAQTLANVYPQVRSEVIYYPIAPPLNGANAQARAATRAEIDVPDDSVAVIQASRMEPWKGQSVCLRALGTLRDLPGWVCCEVGGPQRPHEAEYFQSLKDLAVELGIADRVRFLGQRSDVSRLLAAADIYCQPNTGPEGLPIVFGEALYAGLPIVTSELGGFWELVDESCGMLVPPGDVAAFAAALRTLIKDRDLRAKLQSNGPARAQHFFAPSSQIRKLGDLLANVSARPRRLEVVSTPTTGIAS
jgi:glycosyltransferase involved in cell wall biosynthesis